MMRGGGGARERWRTFSARKSSDFIAVRNGASRRRRVTTQQTPGHRRSACLPFSLRTQIVALRRPSHVEAALASSHETDRSSRNVSLNNDYHSTMNFTRAIISIFR